MPERPLQEMIEDVDGKFFREVQDARSSISEVRIDDLKLFR